MLTAAFFWERATGRRIALPGGSSSETIIEDWRAFGEEGHRFGPLEAPLTLVTFSDYQCSACRFFHKSLKAAERELGDSLAVVFRHLPLSEIHPMSEAAATASECASAQGKFRPYHEKLFENSAWFVMGKPELIRYAEDVGVPDPILFSRCLERGGGDPAIQRDRAAAEELGVAETPALLINDRLMKGAVDSTTLVELLRKKRK
jgi:protein-disulfide isomerase